MFANFNVEKAQKLIEEKLGGWLETAISHIPNLVVAIVITIVFALLARVLGSIISKVLKRSLDSEQIAGLMTSIVKILILTLGVFIALDFLGLKGTVTSLLAGAGIVGLAIGFAFQDMTENLIAGVAMGIRKPFRPGDVIESGDVFGTVKSINLRNTLVENFYGQLIIIPNKILFRNILTNYNYLGTRRIEVPVGISYGDDIEAAEKAIVEHINNLDFVIRKEDTAVYADGFGDSAINLLVWFWIAYPNDDPGYMEIRNQAYITVKKALDSVGVTIPFPIRTLDFGIKGGEKLVQMLPSQSPEEGAHKQRGQDEKPGQDSE